MTDLGEMRLKPEARVRTKYPTMDAKGGRAKRLSKIRSELISRTEIRIKMKMPLPVLFFKSAERSREMMGTNKKTR